MTSDLYKLQGPISLLRQAWNIFSEKLFTFWGIASIPIAFVLITSFLATILNVLGFNVVSWISFWSISALLLIITILFFWSQISLLYSIVNEESSIKDSYLKSKDLFLDYLVLTLFVSVFIIGGFILFVVPGIVLLVLLSMPAFFLVAGGLKGMEALAESYDYVRNHWGQVFLRIIFIVLTFVAGIWIASWLLQLLGFDKDSTKSLVNIAIYFTQPIVTIYYFLIYKDLKEANKELKNKIQKKVLIKWGIAFIIFIAIIIIYLLLHPAAMSDLSRALLQ